MAKIVYPSWLPRLSTPVVKDASDDLRAARGDYQGGAFAGYAGSFYDVWREAVSVTSPGGGGTVLVNFTAVPAGYLYVMQRLAVYHNDTVARQLFVSAFTGAVYQPIVDNSATPPGFWICQAADLVLKAGDYVQAGGVNFAGSKTFQARIRGYTVRL